MITYELLVKILERAAVIQSSQKTTYMCTNNGDGVRKEFKDEYPQVCLDGTWLKNSIEQAIKENDNKTNACRDSN